MCAAAGALLGGAAGSLVAFAFATALGLLAALAGLIAALVGAGLVAARNALALGLAALGADALGMAALATFGLGGAGGFVSLAAAAAFAAFSLRGGSYSIATVGIAVAGVRECGCGERHKE
jgi:hypothetical protein